MKMQIADCFVQYGRPAVPAGAPYLTPAALLADMDRLGIADVWCTDVRALENSPRHGNRLLGEALAGHARLHPVWVVLPPETRETVAPEDLPAALAAAGSLIARADPGRHGYSIAEWCSGALWRVLERFRVPLLLDANGAWDGLDSMLLAHPELPVILVNLGYRCARMLYPLLERHANLRIEISGYVVNEGLREIADRFGAGRLLFGSGAPAVGMEASIGALRFSGLNAADLAAVAEGNLTRLVAEAARRLNAREDEA
jgi:hypothetical protein